MWILIVPAVAFGLVLPPLSSATLTLISCTIFPLSSLVPRETRHSIVLSTLLVILSATFGIAVKSMTAAQDSELQMAYFLASVMPFHIVEFTFVSIFQRDELTASAFLLNPVPFHGYCIAMMAGILEYHVSPLGLVSIPLSLAAFLAFVGWLVRTSALFTAKINFTHVMRETRHPDHALITHGIYSFVRHPGYVGWFLWAVSTQLVLQNHVCLILYGAVSFLFFKDRIRMEEVFLKKFFGHEYRDYARRVPCGIPFISKL